MVGDYISRDAAMPDGFCVGVSCQNCPFCDDPIKGGCKVARFIDAIPAADVVERKKGKWEHLSGDEWLCNQCGFVLSTEGSWEHPLKDREKFYCEHCGADMREDTT